ncbi:MAG TPA: hypothetical protein RMH99_28080 [Sandaracinaceae bacterium LLY-WYZ-13_1]|nr:hypothetical protein [Sandaracinaceae bacterium LLY-WYZ-13_1]
MGDDLCGSTVLARMMGASRGVEVAGELHWLADLSPGEAGLTRARWRVDRQCRIHGAECTVFGPLVHQSIPPADVYATCLEAFARASPGARYVVCTDKYPTHYGRFAAPGSCLGIVLFKHPLQALASHLHRRHYDPDQALGVWKSRYLAVLGWAETFFSEVAYLEYGALATRPSATVGSLWDALGLEGADLPSVPGALADEYHLIGGNLDVPHARTVTLDEKWALLRGEVRERAFQDSVASTVYAELRKRAARSALHWRGRLSA